MYFLHSLEDEGPDADPDWVRTSCGTLFCERCRVLNRTLYPRPVDVVLRDVPRGRWTFGMPFRVGIMVYRADFVQVLKSELRGFALGRCFARSGELIPDYVTFYARNWVVMRGDSTTKTEVCESCGSVWTDLVIVFPGRPAYLLRHQLTENAVQQGCDGALYMTEEFAHSINWSRFPDIRLRRIEIRETPVDGRTLPGDLNWNSL